MISFGRIALLALGVFAYRNRHKVAELLLGEGNAAGRDRRGHQAKLTAEPSSNLSPHDVQAPARQRGLATSADELRRPSEFANQAEVAAEDIGLFESVTGRVDNKGAEPGSIGADEIDLPRPATPRSLVTARHDDSGDANETLDGLDDTAELTRRLAEDTPSGEAEDDRDPPVYERGRTRTTI
jgi:hypothetical protein